MAVSVATRGGPRRGAAAAIAVLALATAAAHAGVPEVTAAAGGGGRGAASGPDAARALLAFLPARPARAESLLDEFADRGLATGLTSPTVGGYTPQQVALDIGQGARLSARTYHAPLEHLRLRVTDGRGRIEGWRSILDRADDAAGTVQPGLLATTIAAAGGRVSYAATADARVVEALAAADSTGRIDRLALTGSSGLAERTIRLGLRSELAVVRLPPGRHGLAALDRLIAQAGADDLLYVMQAPPDDGALLPTGVLRPGLEGLLTSETTRTTGLVAATDVAPTVLAQLGIEEPSEIGGQVVEGERGSIEDLERLADRLEVIVPRRDPALGWLFSAWAALLAALALARGDRGLRAGLRIGFLAALWVPGVALVTAALRPDEPAEIAILAAGALGLGAACDRLVAWPAAPLVPAAAVLIAHAVDLAAGSPLIVASLAGPNPRGGARFYGVGNELETILAVTVLLGTGAALAFGSSRGGGRPPRVFAAACLLAAAILGAGRLGAAVGAVITLGAGGAAAVLASLPVPPTRRALALALAAPLALLIALAAIDVATAGGAHFSREVLEGGGAGELLDTVQRRLELSLSSLKDLGTALAVALCATLLVLGVVKRRSLLAPLDSAGPVAARAFRAGLVGALVATVAAALANDSGPMIFLIGSVLLLLAVAYVHGRPTAQTRA